MYCTVKMPYFDDHLIRRPSFCHLRNNGVMNMTAFKDDFMSPVLVLGAV